MDGEAMEMMSSRQMFAEGEGFGPLEGMFRYLAAPMARGGME
jgi:hypothetical protein